MKTNQRNKANNELIKGNAVTLILKVLSRRDLYGYELLKEIERRSEGIFSLTEGTLYPVLHELEREGRVESYWSERSEARKRKYYRITQAGRAILKERTKEWEFFKTALDRILETAKRTGWT